MLIVLGKKKISWLFLTMKMEDKKEMCIDKPLHFCFCFYLSECFAELQDRSATICNFLQGLACLICLKKSFIDVIKKSAIPDIRIMRAASKLNRFL